MDLSNVNAGLQRHYESGSRVVFWHDPDQEFAETLADLELPDTRILRLDKEASLAVKIEIERDNPKGKYLLYAPFEAPEAKRDWLLDIRKYSPEFRADRASILLTELGLDSQTLREHLKARGKFLAAKDRIARLQKFVLPDDKEQDLDRKMIAVLARSETAELDDILIQLFSDAAEQADADFGALPGCWEEVEKFGLADPLWLLVREAYGFDEDKPSFKGLLIRLFVSDFNEKLGRQSALPDALKHLLLPTPAGRANAAILLSQWRDSRAKNSSFDRISDTAAEALKIGEHLSGIEPEDLAEVMTFSVVEKYILTRLVKALVEGENLRSEDVRSLISYRNSGHWADPNLPSTVDFSRPAFCAAYDGVIAASDLMGLVSDELMEYRSKTAEELLEAYTSSHYRIDQAYRGFIEAAQIARSEGWDVLKELRAKIEDWYANRYLLPLSLEWNRHLDPAHENGLLASWHIRDIPGQQRFFAKYVKPVIAENKKRRVFVIISDALRYEAAEELCRHLGTQYRYKAELSPMLGVLPSYTALGMAALLPHDKLSIDDKGQVLIDGQSTAAGNRDAVLAAHDGTAVKAEKLLKMKKNEGRAFIKDKQIVYIYHNVIDAIGDSASTESETFAAVRRAIEELAKLTRHIINSLNGGLVYITADHGFLYQEGDPGLAEKSKIDVRPKGAVIAKKRYIIGQDLGDHEAAWRGDIAITASAEPGTEFWVPKGLNRFHFSGGARFVHGGAMPQEIVLPLIAVRELEGESAKRAKKLQTGVQILGASHKVTTNRHSFKFLQTDAVGLSIRALSVEIGIYDGDELISNLETLLFDSEEETYDNRIKLVTLSLKGKSFDRKHEYHLIIRNAESSIEEMRVPVTIDLAFIDEF